MRQRPLRYLAVVDAIVAGEGNGPMSPDPKACGMIVAGTNPLAVDSVCCALMGFDWRKMRMLVGGFDACKMPIADFGHDEILVLSNRPHHDKPLSEFGREDGFGFQPHFGWLGAIELR